MLDPSGILLLSCYLKFNFPAFRQTFHLKSSHISLLLAQIISDVERHSFSWCVQLSHPSMLQYLSILQVHPEAWIEENAGAAAFIDGPMTCYLKLRVDGVWVFGPGVSMRRHGSEGDSGERVGRPSPPACTLHCLCDSCRSREGVGMLREPQNRGVISVANLWMKKAGPAKHSSFSVTLWPCLWWSVPQLQNPCAM